MKTFQTTKCKGYLHEKLHISKGAISSWEIASALGKQGVINIRRISIRKGEERIQINTYTLTFNQPLTPREVKISCYLEKVEQYIPAHLRCFKCQKYGHHREEPLEDNRHELNVVKRNRTIWKKIVWSKLHVQTANKIIRLSQDLEMFT